MTIFLAACAAPVTFRIPAAGTDDIIQEPIAWECPLQIVGSFRKGSGA